MGIRGGTRANLTLALTSALVVLLVLALAYEVVANVRYYRWRASFDNLGWIGRLTVASANPVLLWEYPPYGEASEIATNRFPFREVDYATPAKPAGIRRVAFLGDSVTLGMGVVPSDTFVARVGALAQAAGRPLQTLNFGVDGYNAPQIQELLTAKVLEFEPDQVVYVFLAPVFPDPPSQPGYFACYPLQDLHVEVRREAERHGLRIHDAVESFARQDPALDTYSLDLWHLDREGHRVVAESILPVLLAEPVERARRP